MADEDEALVLPSTRRCCWEIICNRSMICEGYIVGKIEMMLSSRVHIAIILISLIICLLPLLDEKFLELVAVSDLLKNVVGSETFHYSVVSSISISIPLAFDFLLDVFDTIHMYYTPKKYNGSSVVNRVSELCVRFFCMAALVSPNYVLATRTGDIVKKLGVFICLSYWRDIAVSVSIFFILGQRRGCVWTVANTLVISVLIATAFLMMEFDMYAATVASTYTSYALFYIGWAYFLCLFAVSCYVPLKRFFGPPVQFDSETKEFYISLSYSTILVMASISLAVHIIEFQKG